MGLRLGLGTGLQLLFLGDLTLTTASPKNLVNDSNNLVQSWSVYAFFRFFFVNKVGYCTCVLPYVPSYHSAAGTR